ncbi:MAG: T9SS type A sorting domain-containing protein [Bacteroidaceae bacterium]|nr:T9SS type A sorting domain-containing protein [Bacteroidaceae bacterium]
MKKEILLTVLGLSCFSGMAIAQRDYLCLYAKNQTDNNSWNLDEIRKITFSSTDVNVYLWEMETTYVLPYENVRKFTFEAQPLPNRIEEREEVTTFYLKYDAVEKRLLINGSSGNGQLQLYSYSGVLFHSVRLSPEETAYSLESLPTGIYIVKYTDEERIQSLKIQVK